MKINKKGFTLVELLAVIVILAIILVIVVPSIINTINESKNGSLISSAKLIAASAETKKMTNNTLEITEEITCDMVADINDDDYESCSITFDEDDNAIVSIKGKGKFEGKYICNATRNDAKVSVVACSIINKSQSVALIKELLITASEENGLIEKTIKIDGVDTSTGIRYVGKNPNNYIYFNCLEEDLNGILYGNDDYDYKTSCETWRIIGVFNTEISDGINEELIKIVRDESIINMSWDSSDNDINKGYGVNYWNTSDLQYMLNTYYIGETKTCTYCNGSGQTSCINDCTNNIIPLNNRFRNMVQSVVWKTGGITYTQGISLETMYKAERDNLDGKSSCNEINGTNYEYCNDNITRMTDWKGAIGLIYPSDYAYASSDVNCQTDVVGDNSTCENNNWLHPNDNSYWTISASSNSGNASDVWNIYSGVGADTNSAKSMSKVHPTLYLKSNIRLEGSGTNTDYYKIVK